MTMRTIMRTAKRCVPRDRQRCSSQHSAFSATSFHSDSVRVGFVGLGSMGLPMSLRLHAAQVPLLTYDAQPAARERAAQAGLAVVDSLTDILHHHREESSSSSSDQETTDLVVFCMLPHDRAVHAVLHELLQASAETKLTTKLTIFDSSTVSPATSRYWNQQWQAAGHVMVDAPVSGGVVGAAQGTLSFLLGRRADNESHRVALPHLECMGRNVIYCGGPGHGSIAKLCNNLALAAQMVGICEAMKLGESLLANPNDTNCNNSKHNDGDDSILALAAALNASTARSWSCESNNPHPVVAAAQNGSPAAKNYTGGFAAGLMLKDLNLALATARECDLALPLTEKTRELYDAVSAVGQADRDFGVLFQSLGRNNDVAEKEVAGSTVH